MIEMMNSASPSQQLPAFAQGMMQQRGFPPQSQAVQSSQQSQVPSSMTSGGAQSPSRSLFGNLGAQRGILPNIANNLSQIRRPNPLTSGILSSSTGAPNLGAFGRQLGDSMVPNFDLSSDFPSLGNRGGLQQSGGSQNARNYVGVMSTKQQESTQEFQIQQEDFPALPKPNSGQTGSTDNARKTPPNMLGMGGAYENSMKDSKAVGEKLSANGQRKGIQTMPDGTVTNIPQGMVTDQFGMVGLLAFIRAAETDPSLVALAPGIDLTTLGLNLNSPENLYSTFQSPWADSPCRPQDIDFHVPPEYLTNIFIREKLAPFKLNRYGENLLFFLFYMNGGDVLQLAAAAELYNRDWRYHKEERVWITRATGMEPEVKTNTYERGTYYFFDAQNWRKVMKQFHLEYDKLEERPQLPVELLMNVQNAMPGTH